MKTIISIIIALLLLVAIASCNSESGNRTRLTIKPSKEVVSDTTFAWLEKERQRINRIAMGPETANYTSMDLIYVSPSGDKLYACKPLDNAPLYLVENAYGEIVLITK